jgi:hypothetical protein
MQIKKQRRSEKTGYCLKVECGERPFSYSAEYQGWTEAVKRRDDRAMTEHDRAWRKRFCKRVRNDHGDEAWAIA